MRVSETHTHTYTHTHEIIMIYVADMAILCVILTILTMTKYVQNLLRDSTLSIVSIAKFFSVLIMQKTTTENLIT